jgi:hypothetical protein
VLRRKVFCTRGTKLGVIVINNSSRERHKRPESHNSFTLKFFNKIYIMKKAILIWVLIVGLAVFGEVRCIVKAVKCNWEPVGKAEIVYAGASITGLGAIVGYFNIEDK